MPRKKEVKEQKEQDLFALLTSIETQLKLMDKRMEVLELQQKLSDTKQAPVATAAPAPAPASTPITPSATRLSQSEDVPKTPDTAPERTNAKPATGGSRAHHAHTEDPARDLTPFGLLRRLSLVA
jgi:hypothetical protein